MKRRRSVVATLATLPLMGCLLTSSCTIPPTQAELATYQAVAPEYAAYVISDPNMPPDGIQRRLDLVESWRIRVGAQKP